MDLAAIALMFFGIEYIYGGNNPTVGLDCSALTCEALRSIGKLDKKDYSAQMLFNKFISDSQNGEIKRNTILFFGRNSTLVSHVAIAIDENLMIEAGGEGREASDKGYVRIRPISNRSDFLVGVNL